MQTRARLDAIVGDVQHDQPIDIREFVDAVLALSDDPGPANLERYLAASRELEDSQAAPAREVRNRARGRVPARAEPAKADA